jgi:hypothetical protein
MAHQDIANVGPVGSAQPSPVRLVLDFFSSIWLGVTLLTLLFVYGSIGSAGLWVPGRFEFTDLHNWVHDIYWFFPWTQLHIRQAPGLEMTEFEWFHWWPFNLLILVMCINIIVATVRRIPFNVLNLGVWMIHGGIIVLAVGSVMYFATKLEGDAPVVRRQIVVNVPGHEPVAFIAMPGNQMRIETDAGDVYRFRIMSIDPSWEVLSGEHEGTRTFGVAVAVAVQGPTQQFVRQLLAGFPQYTEDSVRTEDPQRPLVRAINTHGRRLVDESIDMQLTYAPQEYFYLMDSAAIYIREKGETEWIQRPIRNLPRYNEYLSSSSDVFMPGPLEQHFLPRPLELRVDAWERDDPLPDVPMYVTHYLRYAAMRTERFEGGDRIDPAIRIRLASDRGQVEDHELVAFDPDRNHAAGGRLHFVWVDSEAAFHELTNVVPATVTVRVPEDDVEVTLPARPAPAGADEFIAIEGTDYEIMIETLQDGLQIGDQTRVSLAIVAVRTPERTFRRWVFDHPDVQNRDLAMLDSGSAMHDEELELDTAIEMRYQPAKRPAPVTLIAGPGENDLHMLLAITGREPSLQRLAPNRQVNVQRDITLEVLRYAARTVAERRPFVVPLHQREAGDRQQRSMIRVHVPHAGGRSVWLPYHLYPFARESEVMRRFPYLPTEVALEDGRVIELKYSRERRPLPAPVVLEDFVLTTHIGGFTGQSTSIRDWTSVVKFQTDDGWTEPLRVSMNKPAQYGGFSYFQSQWDPPDQPRFEGDIASQGLNFTVLGVGNRHGVWTQLTGAIIAVIGMLYAFYVKPFLKRRRQQAVYSSLPKSREALVEQEPRKAGQGDGLRS